jgi:hypothetical protein
VAPGPPADGAVPIRAAIPLAVLVGGEPPAPASDAPIKGLTPDRPMTGEVSA